MTTNAKDILRTARKAARDGFFAWPGGYQQAAVMSDGACLCVKCFRENYRNISESTRHGAGDGWRLAGVDILWEGPADTCAHCGAEIKTAYGCSDESEAAL